MELLTYSSFDHEGRPYYLVTDAADKIDHRLIEFGTDLTLKFDMNQRFCVGGHTIDGSRENWACPDHAEVDKKYEQCRKCMEKVGFNPAFYHSDNVSTQQQEYNTQPHNLYLAYFADGFVKVGISHERRGTARLLEQGARAAIVLEQFGSATVARQYEAKVAALPGVLETLTLGKKLELLSDVDFDFARASEKLLAEKARIEQAIDVKFASDEVLNLNKFYGQTAELTDLVDMSERGLISGKVMACVGSILVAENDGERLALPLKKFIGYKFTRGERAEPVDLPPRQSSLF